jgi:hypothetical protein
MKERKIKEFQGIVEHGTVHANWLTHRLYNKKPAQVARLPSLRKESETATNFRKKTVSHH